VVLNLNPYFVLEEGPDPKIAKDQLHRAASLCFASVKMASSLRNQTLKPDIFKGKPLCMDQFKALFGSSRQPTLNDSDDVHVYNDSTHGKFLCSESHISITLRRGTQSLFFLLFICYFSRCHVPESTLLFFSPLAGHGRRGRG
jgi:Choline/Carnitine o-acyltransferase